MFARREDAVERSIGGKKEEDETSPLLDSGDSRTKLQISSFVGKVPARRIRPAGKNRMASRTEGWVARPTGAGYR